MIKFLYPKMLCISMLIVSTVVIPITGQTYWNRSYEAIPYEMIKKVIPTRDCNVIAVGSFNNKACIVKMSPYGDSLWTRLSSVEMGTTGFSTIIPAHDGDFITGGSHEKKVTLTKIRTTGEIIWTKVYPVFAEYSYADVGITPLADGNFAVMGCKVYPDSSWFIKIDSNGDVLQTKTLPTKFSFGSLAAKSDGSFLVGGNPVYRISCTGELLNSYPIPNVDRVNEIKMLPDESCIALGLDQNTLQVQITKLDKTGKVTYSRSYPDILAIHSFTPTADGRLLAVGLKKVIRADSNIDGQSIVVKFDRNGDILWTKEQPPLQRFWSIAQANSGMFIAGGAKRGMLDGDDIYFSGIIDDQYARKGSLFRFKIPVASNSLHYTYSSINVPSGMEVSSGGIISWTPQVDSSYRENVAFQVTDSSGKKDTLTFNIMVNNDCIFNGLRFLEDLFVKKGSTFSFKLSFFGDSLTYQYHPLDFPAGMNISVGGTITWIPSNDCLYNVKVLESDSEEKDTIAFTISVNSYNLATPISIGGKQSPPSISRDITITTSATDITFSTPSDTRQLAIYDIRGRQMRTMENIHGQSEWHIVNKPHYSTGQYIAIVKVSKNVVSKSFFLSR